MTKLIVTVLIIIAALWILGQSRRRRHERVSRLYPPPGQGTDADVERLVRARRKMSAIKLYREIHNVDLTTAKNAVEALSKDLGMEK